MNKVRSNALWNCLTCDQRKTLDKWLFEEKRSYTEVWRRAQTQFKYAGSESSMRRYYYRRRKERTIEEFKDLRDEVAAISGAPADPETVRLASVKVLGMFLFRHLRNSPQNIKEIVSVAKLIIQNDYNELLWTTKEEEFDLRRELKEKDHEIRLKATEFSKDKFQYDVIQKAVKALPHLQRLAEAMKDPDPTEYRQRAIEARQAMFGAGEGVLPESKQGNGETDA